MINYIIKKIERLLIISLNQKKLNEKMKSVI